MTTGGCAVSATKWARCIRSTRRAVAETGVSAPVPLRIVHMRMLKPFYARSHDHHHLSMLRNCRCRGQRMHDLRNYRRNDHDIDISAGLQLLKAAEPAISPYSCLDVVRLRGDACGMCPRDAPIIDETDHHHDCPKVEHPQPSGSMLVSSRVFVWKFHGRHDTGLIRLQVIRNAAWLGRCLLFNRYVAWLLRELTG